MTERPIDLSSLTTRPQPRRSLHSARKLALMASVVAGIGDCLLRLWPVDRPEHVRGARARAGRQ